MTDEKQTKAEIEASARHVDLGQMLDVQATPEEERKVLWKLDVM